MRRRLTQVALLGLLRIVERQRRGAATSAVSALTMPLIGQKIIQCPDEIGPKPAFVPTGRGKRVPVQQAKEELLCQGLRIEENKTAASHFGIDRIPVAPAKFLQRFGR